MENIKETLEAIKKGDQDSLEKLIKALKPLRQSLQRKYPYLDPEDLNQDLIILTIEAIKNYKEEASHFFYYIKKLSTWYCLDQIKGLKYENSLNEITETGEEKIQSLKDPRDIEKEIEEKESQRKILAAIKKLERKEAYVIYSYYYKGKTLKEIGEKLKISPSSVTRLHKKGMRKLKKFLVEK